MSSSKSDLNPSLYTSITQDDLAFFRQAINRPKDDDDAIKQHILAVQAKAYNVHNYNCIRRFAFVRPKIAYLPGYMRALELLKTRKDPILLDIGCCFGNDIRKAVIDGWPTKNIVASDLRREFWDIGHELFESTEGSFPVRFVPGDVFNNDTLSIDSPLVTSSTPLSTLTTLTPLINRVSAIHTSSLFHLFSEAQQLLLAQRLSTLLVRLPGSIIFGQHGSRHTKGLRIEAPPRARADAAGTYMFCHSPESWRKMWVEDVFAMHDGSVNVKVDAQLVEVERPEFQFEVVDPEAKFWVMNWSVEIL